MLRVEQVSYEALQKLEKGLHELKIRHDRFEPWPSY